MNISMNNKDGWSIAPAIIKIKIYTKRYYLIRRSSAAPPDTPRNSYKAITATFDPHQYLERSVVINTALNKFLQFIWP